MKKEFFNSILRTYNRSMLQVFFVCFGLMVLGFGLQAQTLDYENRVSIALKDGTQVVLYGRAQTLNSNFTGDYFYLPVGLTLGKKADGETPEFLFMKYTTEERTDAGGVQGALLHFLMEWGLTQEQEKEAQTLLSAVLLSS